ncbi:MAG TPA: ABC transporter substrate binding protein [Candidatus Acidoferrum sp.]
MPGARGAAFLYKCLKLSARFMSLVATAALAAGLFAADSKVCPAGDTNKNIAARKNVLLLLPDNLGFEGQMELVQILRKELDVPDRVELYVEALDLMRLKDSQNDKKFVEIYRTKYDNVKMDVVVAGQRPVLEFLLNHRKDLFVGAPIVFGIIPKDIPAPTQKYPGVTGVVEPLHFEKTLDLALALQPDTRKLVLIAGSSPRDRWLGWIAKQQIKPYENRVQVEYWEGPTPEEARERLRRLSPDTVVCYIVEYSDHLGRSYSGVQYLEKIAPHSPVPIYGFASSYVGNGAIGGYVYDPQDEARKIATQINSVLAGKNPDDLPILEGSMYTAVDWRELQRWKIPVSRAPAGAQVEFREPPVWRKYSYYFWAIAAFAALETALVLLMLAQIKRKNRAQRMLERRFAIERVAAECAERLAHCPAQAVDHEIQKALEAVLEAEKVDRGIWVTVDADGELAGERFLALRDSSEKNVKICERAEVPWIMGQVATGKPVSISSLDQLPLDAALDRANLQAKGIQSMVVVPSGTDSETRGALVLLGKTPGRVWPNPLVARLGMIGSLFGNAVGRRRAEQQLLEKQEWLHLALEASMTALWELDVRTGRVRWSQRQSTLLGKDPVELEASYQKFLELIPEEDRDDLHRRALALLTNKEGDDAIVTEWRFHEPGGAIRWLLFRGRVFRDERGKPLRLRGVNVDITDLKQAKMELMQLTERLIRAQEDERQRLARDLHDDIGQRLSLLIIGLDRLKHELSMDMRREREQVGVALDEASTLATDIHGLSHQLHSSKLQHLGLKSALRELCSQMSRQHASEVVLFTGTAPWVVTAEKSLCLYRVAQEALKNAAKHSGSSKIEVELEALHGVLELRVRDNGQGFDVNNYEPGLGIASMRERMRMVGGTLEIHSARGQGTEIVTRVEVSVVVQSASAD